MRTIKFRGRSIYDKEWYQGDLEYNRADNIARIHTYDKDGYYVRQYYVNPDTIGQFIGLRDKHGKEIYEGDILKVGDVGLLEVRFVRGVFAFLWNGSLDDEFPTGSPTHEWAEVIGNIHDNPEVLEGGEEK